MISWIGGGGKIFDTNDDREPDSDDKDTGDLHGSREDWAFSCGLDDDPIEQFCDNDDSNDINNEDGLLDVLVCQHRSNLEMLGRALVDFDVDRVKPCLAGIMK